MCAMKVFDLGCDAGHAFEGWFGSEEDYVQQKASGLLECPFCASREVSRRLSAPRLNLRSGAVAPSGGRQEAEASSADAQAPSHVPAAARPPSPEAAATMAVTSASGCASLAASRERGTRCVPNRPASVKG